MAYVGPNLSVYKQGTWTPTIEGAGVAGVTTYTTQQGSYTRIGDTVFVSGLIVITGATGTGNAVIGGLPFTVNNDSNYSPRGTANINSTTWTWPASTTAPFWALTRNTTTGTIPSVGSGVATAQLQMNDSALTLTINAFYRVA